MGEIMKVQCGFCGAEWHCMEGSGLLYGKKENIIAAFSEGEQAEVAARIERSKVPTYDFAYRIMVCNHCKSAVSVPVLVTWDDETYVGACPTCGRKVRILVSDMEKTVCPKCKSVALQAEPEGQWD